MINIMEEVHGHYTALIEGLFDLVKTKIETWKLTETDWEQWTVLPGEKEPSDDYREGYNAGVESVAGLLGFLLDENV